MLGVLGQVLISIASFLLVLTFIVTIHELGHFLVARAFGVKVDRFAVGFGKAVFSRTDRHGIEWRLGWLPLGGYVKFSGDLDASSVPDQAGLDKLRQRVVAERGPGAERDYFHFKPVWQRALVVAAGPIANFILAITIFAVVFMAVGVQLRPARVAQVQAGSPAAAAGFQVGDLITGVNGKAIKDGGAVTRTVMLSTGDPVRFTVERGAQTLNLTAVPERREENDPVAGRVKVGRIGLGLGSTAADVPPRAIRAGGRRGRGRAPDRRRDRLDSDLSGAAGDRPRVWRSVQRPAGHRQGHRLADDRCGRGQPGARSDGDQSGPDADDLGRHTFDRNRLSKSASHSDPRRRASAFLRHEAVARRPVSARFQEMGYRAGLALLAGFMLFATWNDLQKLNLFQFLGGLVS